MKYRGIQCDFGRLTKLFFVTPDSLLFAVQRDTDFFQYTYYGRAFNPLHKSVLKKAGIAVHKSSNRNPSLIDAVGQAVSSIRYPDATVSENRVSRLPYRDNTTANRNSCPKGQAGAHPVKENSTVTQYKKPSAIGTIFFAEGCISECQAIRACLMIRIYNN